MSKMQRDKGKRFEREVVNTLKESGFFGAKRIPKTLNLNQKQRSLILAMTLGNTNSNIENPTNHKQGVLLLWHSTPTNTERPKRN